MKKDVNPAFYEALSNIGREITPEELAKSGVRKVRALKVSEVSRLIERALNRTLVARTLTPIQAEEMADLAEVAEREFKEQLENLEDIEASRASLESQRKSVQVEIGKLRERVRARRAFVEIADGAGSAELRQLLLEIRGALKPLTDSPQVSDVQTKDVVQDLFHVFQARRDEILAEERRAFAGEIENLERRIAKLVQNLERTEQVLARIARTKDLETGIASIYRTVQGLSTGEEELDQKRKMMAAIFAANVALRETLGGAG